MKKNKLFQLRRKKDIFLEENPTYQKTPNFCRKNFSFYCYKIKTC